MFCNRSCSAIGRKAWVNRKKDGPKELHPCQNCGNDIQDWYAGKKYCCQACCRDAVKKREREKTRERLSRGRKCVICGEHFVPASDKEWICSNRCRETACEGEVYIKIIRPGNGLRQDMQPTVGKIYKARRGLTHNQQSIFWIVPGFGKYGVIIRSGEAREVKVAEKKTE